jgi:hypothetical protein
VLDREGERERERKREIAIEERELKTIKSGEER